MYSVGMRCLAAVTSQRWKSRNCSPKISAYGFGRFAADAAPKSIVNVTTPGDAGTRLFFGVLNKQTAAAAYGGAFASALTVAACLQAVGMALGAVLKWFTKLHLR